MQRKLRIWSNLSCSDNRKSAIQNPKWLGLSVIACVLVVVGAAAQAQQRTKVPRIGYLTNAGSVPSEAFVQGLRDLGYIEGKNVAFQVRTTGGKSERLPQLAAELVALKVDVIVAGGASTVTAAKNATKTIPIVMSSVNDPIAVGFVASLAHPGGNITGISNLSPELSGKRLELLKEVIPKIHRVAVLAYRADVMRTSIKETEVAGQSLGLQLQHLEVTAADQIESAFDAAKKQRADALVQIQAAVLAPHQQRIIDLAAKTGYRPCTTIELMLRLVASCRTVLTGSTPFGESPRSLTRSSKASSRQTFPSSSRRSSSL